MKEHYYKQFEKLPPGYRERAVLRCKQIEHHWYGRQNPETLEDSIRTGFIWKNTQEGWKFWVSIVTWAVYGGKLPILPPEID